MTVHDTQLPKVFDTFAVQEGFDPFSDVVPSAAGEPLVTHLSPKEFRDRSKDAFRSAFDAVKDGVEVVDY